MEESREQGEGRQEQRQWAAARRLNSLEVRFHWSLTCERYVNINPDQRNQCQSAQSPGQTLRAEQAKEDAGHDRHPQPVHGEDMIDLLRVSHNGYNH
jgi:hypothetical protein